MAAPVNVASKLIDPYLNFKFIVNIAGKPVAGVSKVGGLTKTTQVVTHREGGAPQGSRKIPGQTEYGALSLERGLTVDVAFEQWANKIWYYPNTGKLGQEVSLADFRKDINIVLYNTAGQAVMSYYVFNCWPSEYHAVPELDSGGNAVAIESLTLQNEGWTRDDSLKPPALPSFALPAS